jgi:CDP-diglyceride synthetase
MSLIVRILFFGLVGVFSGLVAWPCAELVIFFQASFPSLLVFNIVLGVTVGFFMGGCFGTSEGVMAISKLKTQAGLVSGVITGIAGGVIGFVAGQAALLGLGTTFFHSSYAFQRVGFPVSKAIGWATFGMCIGMAHGVRSRSGNKIRNGLLGGFIGGLLGGLAVEYLKIIEPDSGYVRLVGFVLLGLLIGIFYGFIENKLARASLMLLNGKFKEKEFLLTQKMTNIGKSPKTEIGLEGYTKVSDVHTMIAKEKKGFVLTDAGAKTGTYVNDEKIGKKILKDGDVIRVGDAQFLFRKK